MQDATLAAPGPRALDRRSAVWHACDELAAQGVKPTLSKLRPLHKGGSDTDVQADIQAWFARVFKGHLEKTEGLNLPAEIAALMGQLWEAARSGADDQLESQRSELEAFRDKMEEAASLADAARTVAVEESVLLGRDLAAERVTTENLAKALVDSDARETESAALARQERSRSEGLLVDMAAMDARHADELRQVREGHAHELSLVRQGHAEVVVILQAENSAQAEKFDRELRQAEERVRSAERRLMLEQDTVRQSVTEAKRKAQEDHDASELRLTVARKRIEETLTRASGLEATLLATQLALDAARSDAERTNKRMSELALAIVAGNPESKKTDAGNVA